MTKTTEPPKNNSANTWFMHVARAISRASGRPGAFLTALAIILVWAITGPLFNFSDTWQLVINTGTTIVTFLMVFLIQNTQNRDTEALQLKLDELIRAVKEADNEIMDLEDMDDEKLEELRANYMKLAETARDSLQRHKTSRVSSEKKKAGS
jgi:low affinity Fe/Cu permease